MIDVNSIAKKYKIPIEECQNCKGEGCVSIFVGHDIEVDCPRCGGSGYVEKTKKKK